MQSIKQISESLFVAFKSVQQQKSAIHRGLCAMVVHAEKNADPRPFANLFAFIEQRCPQEFHSQVCNWLCAKGFTRKVENGVASWGISKKIKDKLSAQYAGVEGEALYSALVADDGWFVRSPRREDTEVFDGCALVEALIERLQSKTKAIVRAENANKKGKNKPVPVAEHLDMERYLVEALAKYKAERAAFDTPKGA
jgi:hypothetical protein